MLGLGRAWERARARPRLQHTWWLGVTGANQSYPASRTTCEMLSVDGDQIAREAGPKADHSVLVTQERLMEGVKRRSFGIVSPDPSMSDSMCAET